MYVTSVVFECFKSRSGVASLILSPSTASSLPQPTEHPYKQGIDDWRGSRELRVSGASDGAPCGRMRPPEQDGRRAVWGELGARGSPKG
jgi:hypothetical protein